MSRDDDTGRAPDEPPDVNPYEILGLRRRATDHEVKSAYRRMALKYHPDKASDDLKATAHALFQSIALAYAVLSDPGRRRRYDLTGSTSESIVDSQDFNWSDFYTDQFENAVSGETIARVAKEYKNSAEETHDLLEAYKRAQGSMSIVYESVMLSNPAADEARFRKILDTAIKEGKVRAYPAYIGETGAQRQKRAMQFDSESAEAMAYAEELGVKDKLFTTGSGTADHEALKALIHRKRQEGVSFLDRLEAKYAPKVKGKRGKKRDMEIEDEISKEAFQAAASRLNTRRPLGEVATISPPRAKRNKR